MPNRFWLAMNVVLLHLAACSAVTTPPSPTGGSVALMHSLFDPSWQWRDDQGTTTTLSQWRGVPIVVSAVYTSCTSRCPMTIEKLRTIDDAYRLAGVHAEVFLITLDPRSDTPERLHRFRTARGLPDSWHLLAGDEKTTHEAARFLGAHAAFDDGHIDHDARISVFDAQGRLARTAQGWNYDAATMVVR